MASSESSTPTSSTSPAGEVAVKKRAPTFYAIIAFKVVKGILFTTLAVVVYCLSDNDLPKEYQHFLHLLRIQPDNKFWSALAIRVGELTEVKLLWAAAGTMVYSLFAWVEGIGLMFRVSWAGWLAIGESIFFIPLEMYDLLRRFSWSILGVLIINIVIVWYLLKNRERLFRHHHG